MQTSKSFVTICAVVLLAGSEGLSAADTDAQIRAREALRSAISAMDTQQPPAKVTRPAPPEKSPKPAPAAPVFSPAASTDTVKIVPPPSAPTPAPAAPPPVQISTPAAPPSSTWATPASDSFSQVPPPSDSEAAAKAREALRQSTFQPEMQPSTGQQVPGAGAAPAFSATPGFKPLDTPSSPLTGSKQERLNELLRRYRADEITPEQYHTQRAKILEEP